MSELDKVTIEKLDVDNYATWSVRVKYFLIHRGLWEAVDGSGQPSEQDDQKALALIILHVRDHHLTTLSKCATAKDAWDTLETVYKAKSTARRLTLRRQLTTLSKGADEPMTKYVARARDINDQLIAAGYKVNDEEVIISVLNGLPSDYDIVATILETSDGNLDLDTVLSKLLQVEQRLSATATTDNNGGITYPKAFFTGDLSGPPRGNDDKKPASDSKKICWYCGKAGHVKADCFKKRWDEEQGGDHKPEHVQYCKFAF